MGRGQSRERRGALIWLAGASLRVLIAMSIVCFVFAAYNCMSDWWLKRTPWAVARKNSMWSLRYQALSTRALKSKPPGYKEPLILTSAVSFRMFMLLASTLTGAVATLCLRSLPDLRRRTAASTITARAKMVLLWQLPPRRLLLLWCGGLSVLDALLWVGIVAMGVVWVWQPTQTWWQSIEDLVSQGPTAYAARYKEKSPHQAKLEALATIMGFAVEAGALALFFPVPRNSFLQALFKSDFSCLIKYHRWAGHITLVFASVHGITWYVIWGMEGRWREEFIAWRSDEIPFLAGSISWFFGLLLWMTTFEVIRRRYFEVFIRMHIVGFMGFYVFGFLHYDGLYYYAVPGFLLYLLDLTFRLAQWMNVSVVTGSLSLHDILTLELSFSPDTLLLPNSFIFMYVGTASRVQWHPFTLAYVRNSTGPDIPAKATLHIKPYGRWGQAVAREIAATGHAMVKVDGPYGGHGPLIEGECTVAVRFAGGIGVTPMLGILDSLCNRCAHLSGTRRPEAPGPPKKVAFVWATRSPADFGLMSKWLQAESRAPDSWLEVRLFCTSHLPDLAQINASRHPKDATLKLGHVMTAPGTMAMSQLNLSPSGQHVYSLSSPFFLKPSLLQGYGIGYMTWALTHCLCFCGAFLAVLTTESFGLVGEFVSEHSFSYWLANLVRLVALFVGGMGLPAVLIFPFFMWRRRNARKAMRHAARDWSQPESLMTSVSPTGEDIESTGTSWSYQSGRPNICSILKEIRASHMAVSNLHVHVAGKDSPAINSDGSPGNLG